MTDAMGRETNFWNVSIENGLVTSGLLYVLASWERFWKHQNVVLENVFRQLASVTHSRFPLMSHAYIPNVFSFSSFSLLNISSYLFVYSWAYRCLTQSHIYVKRLQQTNIYTLSFFVSLLVLEHDRNTSSVKFYFDSFCYDLILLELKQLFCISSVYIYIYTYLYYSPRRRLMSINFKRQFCIFNSPSNCMFMMCLINSTWVPE